MVHCMAPPLPEVPVAHSNISGVARLCMVLLEEIAEVNKGSIFSEHDSVLARCGNQ